MNNTQSKTIGILGGMGPRSTAPFLNLIIDECQLQYGAKYDVDFPSMMILSLPTPFYLDRPLNHELLKRSIVEGLRRLESTGVSFIAMPCNSAHLYFDELQESISIPLLNMVQETLEFLPQQSRVTLFATPTTFESNIYQNAIHAFGNEFLFVESWQEEVNTILVAIKSGKLDSANIAWQQLIEKVVQEGSNVIVSACTDLNVLNVLQQTEVSLVDSARALAKAVVREYLKLKE